MSEAPYFVEIVWTNPPGGAETGPTSSERLSIPYDTLPAAIEAGKSRVLRLLDETDDFGRQSYTPDTVSFRVVDRNRQPVHHERTPDAAIAR